MKGTLKKKATKERVAKWRFKERVLQVLFVRKMIHGSRWDLQDLVTGNIHKLRIEWPFLYTAEQTHTPEGVKSPGTERDDERKESSFNAETPKNLVISLH